MTPTYQNLGGFCGSNEVKRTDDPNICLFVTRINSKDDQKIYLRLFDTRTNTYGPAKQVVSKKAGDFTLNLGPGSAIILPNGEVLIALAGGQGGDDLMPGHLRVPGFGPTGESANGPYTFVNSATDQVARDAANAAGSTAGKALQLASQAMERFKELGKQMAKLPTATPVSDQHIADIAWSKGRDALQGLINEARANPNTSDLVMLIREVVAGKH